MWGATMMCVDDCLSPRINISPPNTCVTNCLISPYIYLDGNKCVQKCTPPSQNIYTANLTCVLACTNPLPYIVTNSDGTMNCVSSCPKFLNNDKLNCVTSCTNYVFNNLYCQDTCNVGYMFTDAQNQKNCVTVCPDIYKNVDVNRNCLLACPLYQIGINCVDQCTGSYPYLLKPNCLKSCPSDLTRLDGPFDSTNMLVNVNICDIKCTNFFARLSDNTRICRDQCITFVKKMNGLYKCMNLTCDPSDSTYLNLCFSSCPLNSKNLAGICIPNCPSNTPLLQIPSSSLILDLTLNNQIQLYYAIYTFLNSISDSSKLTCVSACTTPKIIYHSTCIDICPSGRFVDEKGNCIENCNKFEVESAIKIQVKSL